MKVDSETLKKIAQLARLEFSPEEEEKMRQDLNQMLDWVAQLEEVDTEGVEPLTHISQEANTWREDVQGVHLEREKALLNSKNTDDTYFKVPKILKTNS